MVVGGTPAAQPLSKTAYKNVIEKKGTRSTWRKTNVRCEICGKWMQRASLTRHMKNIHGKTKTKYIPRENTDNRRYNVSFLGKEVIKCPVKDCKGRLTGKHSIYKHFCLRHPDTTIVVEEDGILPRYNLCGYFSNNIEKRQISEVCRKGKKEGKCKPSR